MEFENNFPIYIQVINQIKKIIITGKHLFVFKNPQSANYHIYRNRCDIWNTILFI